jgi:glycerophosphoryl diester phosphodiesterase
VRRLHAEECSALSMTRDLFVIAHRGASGYLPEHTLEAKALAYGLGADFLEQDVVATRDGELVVLHDLHLDEVTDVAQRFPGRHRPDGRHYVIDFELAELQQLRVSERRRPGSADAVYPGRFPVDLATFRVATFEEEVQLVQGLNRSTGRNVGLYPEIKHPDWHLRHGIDLSRLLLDKLDRYGYRRESDVVFVQCFDAGELERLRFRLDCSLRLVQLVGSDSASSDLLTAPGLARVATYAHGLGPHYSQLVSAPRETRGTKALSPSPLLGAARSAGLSLHPYTFRRDDLPPYVDTLDELLMYFLAELGVDGVFCDHPDIAVRARNAARARALS